MKSGETSDRPRGFGERLGDFWYHYKSYALIIIVLVGAAGFTIYSFLTNVSADLTVCVVSGEYYFNMDEQNALAKSVSTRISDISGDDNVVVDVIVARVVKNPSGEYDYTSAVQYSNSFYLDTACLYIADDSFYAENEEVIPDLFAELSDLGLSGVDEYRMEITGAEFLKEAGLDIPDVKMYAMFKIKPTNRSERDTEFIEKVYDSSIKLVTGK